MSLSETARQSCPVGHATPFDLRNGLPRIAAVAKICEFDDVVHASTAAEGAEYPQRGVSGRATRGSKGVLLSGGRIRTLPIAHFSDRGHLFQVDRGRRFRAIVDAQGMRASEHLMYFTRQTRFRTGFAKRFG